MNFKALVLLALLLATATAQSNFKQLSARELAEFELRHEPRTLEVAAKTAETVVIHLESTLSGAFVQEGVNVNMDCLPWLQNLIYPGGNITWLRSRFIVDQETGEVQEVEVQSEIQTTPGGRFIIGGFFHRWLNITSTNIIQGREDSDHGNYTCRVCVAQGTCHDATVTVYLPGAPPVINDTESAPTIGPNSELIYNIGTDFCINRGTDETFRIDCDILERDLANGIPGPFPPPFRTWVNDGIVVYNLTQGLNPIEQINMEFFAANMLLVPSVLQPQVFLPTVDGAITFLTRVDNSSQAGIPEDMARNLLFEIYLGVWTCSVNNAYGSVTATTKVTDCASPDLETTDLNLLPSREYPYDPYEPEDPFDPYPFYYCELNEDEYGRPYYGPYDRYVPPSRLTPDSLQCPPTDIPSRSSLIYHIPPHPHVTEPPPIEMYSFSLRQLTNSRKNDVLTLPSCIFSNECNRSPEQCSGDGTQYDSCGRRCTCRNGRLLDCCRVRKEWRSMTQVERCHYVHVIHLVSTRNPWKRCYNALINIHKDRFGSGIHEQEFFLPFHRWYILALENLLRQVDCNITVPYWDWSLEPQSWQNSTFWAAECGFGGDGDHSNNYHVENGVFSQSNNWRLASSADGSLQRHFNGNVPDCATVALIQRTGIAEFNTWHNFVSSNLHDSVHCIIGGTMCTSSAAGAPEFFLTQGFIDQIWASWQSKGYAFKNLPFFSKNDNAMPSAFGYSPADVYDLDNQPGCVKICIEASSRPCRINTTYTPMCPLNMMQNYYSPIKLANAIPKPYPYVSEASYLLFATPFEMQRSANRFSTILNNPNELQSVLQNSGYDTGDNHHRPARGEIQFDRYIYQPELIYPDTFAPNGTRLGPPRECQPYLDCS